MGFSRCSPGRESGRINVDQVLVVDLYLCSPPFLETTRKELSLSDRIPVSEFKPLLSSCASVATIFGSRSPVFSN